MDVFSTHSFYDFFTSLNLITSILMSYNPFFQASFIDGLTQKENLFVSEFFL